MTESVAPTPSQALARKRRKEIIASQKSFKRQRLGDEDDESRGGSDSDSSSCSVVAATSKKSSKMTCTSSAKAKVIKSTTKYQNRYEPEVPMTKEEEVAWRKEARRQRNRESAANSRNKIRNRIQELENEVVEWKAKYAALMDRIDLLEKEIPNSSTISTSCTGAYQKQSPLSLVPSSPPRTPTPTAPRNIYIPSFVSSCSSSSSSNEENFDLSIPLVSDLSKSCSGKEDVPSSSSSPLTSEQLLLVHEYEQSINNVKTNVVTNKTDHHVIDITSRPEVSRY